MRILWTEWPGMTLRFREIGERGLIAEHRAGVDGHVPADVAVASEDRVPDARLTADATIRPDYRAADDGILFDLRLPANHRIGTNLRARLDECPLVDEAGTFDRGAFFNLGIGGDPRARRGDVAKRLGRIAPIHDVAMHLGVFGGGADVDPVAVIDVGDECFTALDERREIAALDRPGNVARTPVERVRLEHVNAGVDVVGGDLVGIRLLEEAANIRVRIDIDKAIRGRVVDRRQHDCRASVTFAMQADDGREIDL